MKIGLQIYQFNWLGTPENTASRLSEMASYAEQGGFSSLWVMDHLWQVSQGFGPPEDPMLEGYSTISYLAAETKKVKLGLMVTATPYRHPGLLVKAVTTLDVLSGGRAILGIGAGWNKEEAEGFGIPFPKSKAELFGRLEETVRIARHIWSSEGEPFEGKYYRLLKPVNHPQPISKPHPPILIGGEGEKRTLRLVAKHGDACNLQLGSAVEGYAPWLRELYKNRRSNLTRKLGILKEHCKNVGRDYDEIEITVLGTVRISPDPSNIPEIVNLCRELNDLGVDQVIFNMPNVYDLWPIERIGAEVIPAVADL